jgi:uncharacterized protein
MEGHSVSGREADIAPASEAPRAGGWTPANPAPLGLFGFACTTMALSLFNANLVGAPSVGAVFPLALAYGGIAQFFAGMWEFRTGNTFGAVAFSSYGAFWVSVYFFYLRDPALLNTHSSLSLFLWMWTIFTAIMFVASLRTSGALALVFLVLTITFILLAIGNAALVGTHSLTNSTIKLGGWAGIITAALAFYVGAAGVINATFGRDVVPVFPLNR